MSKTSVEKVEEIRSFKWTRFEGKLNKIQNLSDSQGITQWSVNNETKKSFYAISDDRN